MDKELIILHISGIEQGYFSEFEELGLELKFVKEGIRAEIQKEVIEYIIVSTIAFPYDFIKDLLKDATKTKFNALTDKIARLWNNLETIRPATIQEGKEPDYKEPKLRVVFPISPEEVSTLEIYGEISEKAMQDLMAQFANLVQVQSSNRLKEAELKSKMPFPVVEARKKKK